MKKQFLDKILKYGKVETRKYIYVLDYISIDNNDLVIKQYDKNSYFKNNYRTIRF